MNYFIFIFIVLTFIVIFFVIYFLTFLREKKVKNEQFLPFVIYINKIKKSFVLKSDNLFFQKNKEYVLNNFFELFSTNSSMIKDVITKYNHINQVPTLFRSIKTNIKFQDGTLKACHFQLIDINNEKANGMIILDNIFNHQQFLSSEQTIRKLKTEISHYFNFSTFIYKIYSNPKKFLFFFHKNHQRNRYGTIGTIKINNFFRYIFNQDLSVDYFEKYILRLINYLRRSFGHDTIIFFSSIDEIVIYKPFLKSRWELKKMDNKFNKAFFRKSYLFNNFFDIKVTSGYYIFDKKNYKEPIILLDMFFKYAQTALLLAKYNQCNFYTIFDSQNQYLNVFLKTFSFSVLKTTKFLNIDFLSIVGKEQSVLAYFVQLLSKPETSFLSANFWNKTAEKFFFNTPAEITSYQLQILKYKLSRINEHIKNSKTTNKSSYKPIYFVKIPLDILFDHLSAVVELIKSLNLMKRVSLFINDLFYVNNFKLFHTINFLKDKNISYSFQANIFNREQLNLILSTKPKYIFIDKYMIWKVLKNIYFLNRFQIFINDCYLHSVSIIFEKHSKISDKFYQHITTPTENLSMQEKINSKFNYYFIDNLEN